MSRAVPCASRTLRLDTPLLMFPDWFCSPEIAGVPRGKNLMGPDPESLRGGHELPLRRLAAGRSRRAASPPSRRQYALLNLAGLAAAWCRPASARARIRTSQRQPVPSGVDCRSRPSAVIGPYKPHSAPAAHWNRAVPFVLCTGASGINPRLAGGGGGR